MSATTRDRFASPGAGQRDEHGPRSGEQGGGAVDPPPTDPDSQDSLGRYIWQEQVLARCRLLRTSWRALPADRCDLFEPGFLALVTAAEAACNTERGLYRQRHGAAVEAAWGNLHHAEALVLALAPTSTAQALLPHVQDTASVHLPAGNLLRTAAADARTVVDAPGSTATSALTAGEVTSLLLASVLCEAYEHAASDHIRIRSFRNTVVRATAAFTLVVLVLVGLGWAWPQVLSTCGAGAAAQQCLSGPGPGRQDTLVIAVLGAAAGALSGVTSIRTVRGNATPFGVSSALAYLKVPTGALSAVLGVVLLRGALAGIDVPVPSGRAVLAWAVVLGAAQQVVTRLADRQARALLDLASSATKKT